MRFWLVATACTVACSPSLPLSTDAVVSCASDGSCPNGLTCVNGERCVAQSLIDTQGAVPINPSADAVVAAGVPVRFAWGTVTDAAGYTLTVATDAAMTNVVTGFPMTATNTVVDVSLAAGTYYWLATADTTSSQTAIAPTRFGVIGDTAYVYCADAAACTAPASADEYCTLELPCRTINRGLTRASTLGASTVAVATPGDGTSYSEPVQVRDGISFAGGYEPTFTTTSGRTPVSVAGVCLQAQGVITDTTVSGLSFTNDGSVAGTSTAGAISFSDSHFVLDNVGFASPKLRDHVVEVTTGANDSAPIMRGSSIDGTVESSIAGETATMSLIAIDAGAGLTLEDTDISGSGSGAELLIGVTIAQGTASITGGNIDVDAGDTGYSVVGVSVTGSNTLGAVLPITGVSITVHGNGLVDGISAVSQLLAVEGSTITLVASAATGSTVMNAVLLQTPSLFAETIESSFVSNVIVLRHDTTAPENTTAFGLTGVSGLFMGNTMIVSGAHGSQRAFDLTTSMPRILDNLIVAAAEACDTAGCNNAIYDRVGDLDTDAGNSDLPDAVLNNGFVGYVNAQDCLFLRTTSGQAAMQTCDDINTWDDDIGWQPILGGNLTAANLAALGLSSGADGKLGTADDKLVPAADTPLVHAGHDVTLNDCHGATIVSDAEFQLLTNTQVPSCGGPFADRNGVARANLPTIGAYEPPQ